MAVKKFIVQAPGFAHKHWNRPEKLARDKHSSLLRNSINYGAIISFIVQATGL
jgi:hypothetical protein